MANNNLTSDLYTNPFAIALFWFTGKGALFFIRGMDVPYWVAVVISVILVSFLFKMRIHCKFEEFFSLDEGLLYGKLMVLIQAAASIWLSSFIMTLFIRFLPSRKSFLFLTAVLSAILAGASYAGYTRRRDNHWRF